MLINDESDVASTKLQNWKSIDLASIHLAFHYSFSNMDFFIGSESLISET